MKTKLFVLALLALLANVSCKKTNESVQAKSQNNGGTEETVELKYATVDDIPKALLTEAVDYYGLLNETERTYKYWKVVGDDPEIGWERVTFLPTAGGNPQFEFRRTGSLKELDDQTVELREDGIYSVKAAITTQKEPWLQIPSSVAIGSTWLSDDLQLTAAGGQVVESMAFTATTIEFTTVEAGTYETLVVEVVATMSMSAKPVLMTIRYAKGVGVVLLELSGEDGTGKLLDQRIELVDDGMRKTPEEEGDEQ